MLNTVIYEFNSHLHLSFHFHTFLLDREATVDLLLSKTLFPSRPCPSRSWHAFSIKTYLPTIKSLCACTIH